MPPAGRAAIRRVQALGEHLKEVSFGHTGKSGERPRGWLRRSSLGVPRARQPPLIAARNNRAVRRPAISAPATLLAEPFALRFSSREPIVTVSRRMPRESRFLGQSPPSE